MDNIRINSWNETDPLRAIMIGTPEKSCNLPNEFPCKIRSFDNCTPELMDENEIIKAKKLMDNLIQILQNDYSVKVVRSDIINQRQKKKLEDISQWSWNVRDQDWQEMYEKLKDYISANKSLPNGEKDGWKAWIGWQKESHERGTLDKQKTSLLNTLEGWEW